MAVLLPILQLAGGLALLIIGAELMVRGAARLAHAFGISSFVVGLTVVAFGTSAPELGGSLRAAFEGDGDLAIGAVVGSNIANICLVMGTAAVICPIPVRLKGIRGETIAMLIATAAGLIAMLGPSVHRIEGIVLTAGLILFTLRAYLSGRRASPDEASELARAAKELDEELSVGDGPRLPLSIALLIAGLVMLYFGSGMLVTGATVLAEMIGVSSAVIGLSIVAFGTSVPELSLSVVAALRKQPDIAIGNIVGSNVFNILCVLGLTALISPNALPVPAELWRRDAWVLIFVSLACLPILGRMRHVSRLEGVVLLGLYAGYMAALFLMRGE
ncbi:MAG: calcium/sodium antiporter [Planctomycetota bacterium]